MQRLYPTPTDEVDPYAAYRPADPAAPLLRLNMVASADGHIVGLDGRSGSLGGDGDSEAFFALRHLADGILVGGGTVRAEDYGGMRVRTAWRERREADGRVAPAPIIVVSGSLGLSPTSRLFCDTTVPPIVVTSTDADPERLAVVREAGAQVVQAGTGDIDLARAVEVLRGEMGLRHLLCEGGGHLNGTLLRAGLVDEICVTFAPTLIGGADPRRIVTALPVEVDLELRQVLEADGELLLTYAVRR